MSFGDVKAIYSIWSCRCQQGASRWSQGMRWCWIQDRGQRALQGRQRSRQDPFWCFAQTLRRWHISDRIYHTNFIITHDSIFAKEDVHNSNVLLPSIVEFTLEKNVGLTFAAQVFTVDSMTSSWSLCLLLIALLVKVANKVLKYGKSAQK